MLVHILLFAAAKERLGRDRVSIDLPPDTTVGELRTILAATHPALTEILAQSRLAVDSEYAADDLVIPPTAEIACIPPVSGG
jgi:molybdopterin converting factor subunit 1